MKKQFIYNAVAIENYDGDTAKFDIDLGFSTWIHKEPVRLFGINASELNAKDKDERAKAISARDYLHSLLFENGVSRTIILETFKDSKEKYGRYLANVHVLIGGEWLNCSQELLKKELVKKYEI